MVKNKNNFPGGYEMKKLVLMMVMFAFATTAFAAPFTDVPRTHWAYDAIQSAVDAGILQGYDGQFHGKRLLNRYQMAVITAKLLAKTGSAAGAPAMTGDVQRMIANLEALTIEFADELALLNVKVSTLEDTVAELRNAKACNTTCKTVGGSTGDLGFTAFASFALLQTDEDKGLVRYAGTDTMQFEMPQVSLGVDKEVDEGVFFHAQFDWNSETNGGGGSTINEAYFLVDELFGDIGAKLGAFALPFSMEHNGPFRSCNLTITPSAINTMWEQFRPYGLEIQPVKDVKPEDIQWKFGIVSGTDDTPFVNPAVLMTDAPASINSTEEDDGFGFYIQLGKAAPAEGGLAWNVTYFDNGGDLNESSNEMDAMQIGLSYSMEDLLFMVQYADGSIEDGNAIDFTSFYFLVNYKMDEKNNLTLRYDDASVDVNSVTLGGGDAITFAWNHKVSENSMMQLEYLMPDMDDADVNSDLFQIRYKVHF
jgi:hypothetical protein